MATLDVEAIDLSAVAGTLRMRLSEAIPDALEGRTLMRDVVAEHLGASLLEAEEIVDTLVDRGFVRLAATWRGATCGISARRDERPQRTMRRASPNRRAVTSSRIPWKRSTHTVMAWAASRPGSPSSP